MYIYISIYTHTQWGKIDEKNPPRAVAKTIRLNLCPTGWDVSPNYKWPTLGQQKKKNWSVAIGIELGVKNNFVTTRPRVEAT